MPDLSTLSRSQSDTFYSSSATWPVSTVHQYHLLNNKDQSWVTLSVHRSRSPNVALLPFFAQGDVIEGVVELNLETERNIEGIKLFVIGSVILAAATDILEFLELKKVLWSRAMGDPGFAAASSPSGPPNPQRSSRRRGHLRGNFSFPFSVTLPGEVELRLNGMKESRKYALPPSFSDRGASASIQYELMVKVKRVVWPCFRLSSRVGTSFGYIPIKKPRRPSVLRQLAYAGNKPLVGVDGDPDGWHTLESVVIRGKIFNRKDIEITCTLSLAKPVTYTRGTAIPCAISISSVDFDALDLLSSPETVVVHLVRKTTQSAAEKSRNDDEVTPLAAAVWWSTSGFKRDVDDPKSTLFGEIRLEKKLKPSCAIAYFKLSYHVVMFPPKSVSFDYAGDKGRPVLSREVEIVAGYADGPRPRLYTPECADEPMELDDLHGRRDMSNVLLGHTFLGYDWDNTF